MLATEASVEAALSILKLTYLVNDSFSSRNC